MKLDNNMVAGMVKTIKFLILFFVLFFSIGIAQADVLNITVSDDSDVNLTDSGGNFGNEPILRTRFNNDVTYLKFHVPTYVDSAKLYIYSTSINAGEGIDVHVTSPDWNENEITWNNIPSIESSRIGIFPIPTANAWNEINLSSVVNRPGDYSFALKSRYGTLYTFNSSEALTNTPYLQIEPSSYTEIIFNNKTNDTNRTFPVDTGECIRFSISPPDLENIATYQWQLNKTDLPITSSYFDFSVPAYDERQPSTGIWEIWVNATYTNGTSIYKEWLISSLPESEAPDYIEYFSDLDNTFRPGFAADPWGRYPHFYRVTTANYISKGYLTGTNTGSGLTMLIDDNYNIDHGTVKFKLRNPGITLNFDITRFRVIGDFGKWNHVIWRNEYHDYYAVINSALVEDNNSDYNYIPISRRSIGQAPSKHWWRADENQWKEFMFINTPDGWWSAWEDGVLIPGNYQRFADAFSNATMLELAANGYAEMDCIEVYKDKYLYPNSRISYGSYPKWWYVANPSSGLVNPVEENGIIAFGQNLTLESISDSINNDSLMTYDTVTNTAIIKTNLFIEAGGKLNITDETLLFDTSTNSLDINLMIHSTFNVENSTISTIGNNPIRWNLASASTATVFNPNVIKNETIETTSAYFERMNPKYDFGGIFIVQNSTINNSCNLFFDGATEIILNNVVFSNHSSSDYGDYTLRPHPNPAHNNQKWEAIGEKALWFTPKNDLVNFIVNNISFVNPKTDISFKVIGGEWIFNSTTVKNCDLSGVDINTRSKNKTTFFVQYWNMTEHSDLSLLNCKFDENKLNVETNHSKLETKYYADVVVKDTSGNPIQNAVIMPTASNNEYGAECLYEWDWYVSDEYGLGQGGSPTYDYIDPATGQTHVHNTTYAGGLYRRWYNAQPLISATTNANGRTALPSGNVNHSIVLVDTVFTNDTGTQTIESITYDISINASGLNLTLDDINPDTRWHRADPDQSKYTIVAIKNNSEDAHITGYAPAPEYNQYIAGEELKLQIWASETPTDIVWMQGGDTIATDSMTCDVVAASEPITVSFSGTTSTGVISKTFDIDATMIAPTANFTANTTSGSYPLSVSFTDQTLGGVALYEWDFDNDGVIDSRSPHPTVKYKAPGTYTVSLTVTNAIGTDAITKTDHITVTGQPPIRNFTNTVWDYMYNVFYKLFGV